MNLSLDLFDVVHYALYTQAVPSVRLNRVASVWTRRPDGHHRGVRMGTQGHPAGVTQLLVVTPLLIRKGGLDPAMQVANHSPASTAVGTISNHILPIFIVQARPELLQIIP